MGGPVSCSDWFGPPPPPRSAGTLSALLADRAIVAPRARWPRPTVVGGPVFTPQGFPIEASRVRRLGHFDLCLLLPRQPPRPAEGPSRRKCPEPSPPPRYPTGPIIGRRRCGDGICRGKAHIPHSRIAAAPFSAARTGNRTPRRFPHLPRTLTSPAKVGKWPSGGSNPPRREGPTTAERS